MRRKTDKAGKRGFVTALAATAISSGILLWGCSKKEAGPTQAEIQNVNVPQFIAAVQNLPPDQRQEYVKQHPTEERAVMSSDDPRVSQAFTNAMSGRGERPAVSNYGVQPAAGPAQGFRPAGPPQGIGGVPD